MEERGGELFSNKMFDKACGFASSALLPAPLSLSDEADSAYQIGRASCRERV